MKAKQCTHGKSSMLGEAEKNRSKYFRSLKITTSDFWYKKFSAKKYFQAEDQYLEKFWRKFKENLSKECKEMKNEEQNQSIIFKLRNWGFQVKVQRNILNRSRPQAENTAAQPSTNT